MTRRSTAFILICTLALALASAVRPAEAQLSKKASVVVKISADPSVGGTAIGAASGTINNTAVTVNELSWTDTHAAQSPLFEGGVGVAAGRNLEILGLINYGHAGANAGVIVGTLAGTPITANFDDYNFWGAEGGVRVRRSTGVGLYGMFTAGFRQVSQIQAQLITLGALRTVTGYDASTVPSFAFGGGVLFGERSFAMGVEIAVRYAGAPAVSSSLTVTPATGAGSRWSLPIGIVFRF